MDKIVNIESVSDIIEQTQKYYQTEKVFYIVKRSGIIADEPSCIPQCNMIKRCEKVTVVAVIAFSHGKYYMSIGDSVRNIHDGYNRKTGTFNALLNAYQKMIYKNSFVSDLLPALKDIFNKIADSKLNEEKIYFTNRK